MRNFKKALIILASMLLCLQGLALFPLAESETYGYAVDSVNGIRWENYICIYRDIPTTGQNIYGCNIVVDSNGRVSEKVPAGDPKGENLAVPEGGYVVSGIGSNSEKMFNSVNVGDNVVFDEYGMRVLFSASEINPFYEFKITATGYNTVRNENTVIIYDNAGEKTGTNPYGCEAVVNAEGRIISMGGNDSVIPEGGYVISVINNQDISNMLVYFIVGAKCEKNGNVYTIKYSQDDLKATAKCELDEVIADFEAAKKQFRLVDYESIQNAIDAIDLEAVTDIETRNSIIQQIKNIKPMLIEKKTVETRSVWHNPTERTAEDIKNAVAMVKNANLNELIIYLTSPNGTLVPIPDSIPFDKDPIAESFDLLQIYLDECRANNISLTVVIPVMSSSLADEKTEWFDATNTGEKGELFYSPANEEYRKAFMEYICFILDNYDIDGLQLDYIRYIGYFGSGTESGYDDDTIALFEEKTGYGKNVVEAIGKKQESHPYWSVWRNFKVELINSWVKECYTHAKRIRPDVYVSAAVAESMSKEAYSQDFQAWLEGGYIDGVYPMTYTQGVNEYTTTLFSGYTTDRSYVAMGSGAFLGRDNEYMADETHASAVYGSDGIAYFELTAMRDNGYNQYLSENVLINEAIPFIGAKGDVVAELLKTAEKRIALYNGENADSVKKVNISSDKESIQKAVADIEALISADDAKWLLRDLKTAIRVYNMNTDTDYTFVKGENGKYEPITDESSQEGSEEIAESSIAESNSENNRSEGNSLTVILVVAGVILVAVIAILLVKFKKK